MSKDEEITKIAHRLQTLASLVDDITEQDIREQNYNHYLADELWELSFKLEDY